MAILKSDLEDVSVVSVNGVTFSTGTLEGHEVVLFLSGISVVNAAMTTQLALDHFRHQGRGVLRHRPAAWIRASTSAMS